MKPDRLVAISFLLSACCITPTSEGGNSTSAGTSGESSSSSGGSCPELRDGGCVPVESCAQSNFQCVTISNQGSGCLGVSGAICQGNCDCLSGACERAVVTDCHPLLPCEDAGPPTCQQSYLGAACLSSGDCAQGLCQHPDAGVTPSVAGTCCGPLKHGCQTDSDCCAGLTCATDNTGCRVGPTPFCTIDGGTYPSGLANPSNDCQLCDPYGSPTAWTNVGTQGTYHPPCGDGGHGGVGPGLNYCCNGFCTDSCSG